MPTDLETCYGCGAAPQSYHQEHCDWARCPDCGEQLLLHDCDHWPDDADGPDRSAIWHGITPSDEVAQACNWWTTAVGIDHLVEDDIRVLIANHLRQITWNPREQRYDIGDIDNAAIDQVLARSR